MKIERIVTYLVGRCLLVRVYTDEGIVGNGEAGLWAHHPTVQRAIEELSDYYIGVDPLRMEHHFQVVMRDTHFSGAALNAAASAMDIAMWDIMGKMTGLPVYQLLGGKVRDKVRCFTNVVGNSLEARAESAAAAVAKGYTSLRTTPFLGGWEGENPTKFIKDAVAIVRTIRETVGDEIDLGLEIHRNLRPDEAITLANQLMPFNLQYYEDPIGPESFEALEYVAKHVNIPIVFGERNYSLYQFRDLIDRGIAAMVRCDLSLAGGYTQCKKIAALAEASFVSIFPHLMGSPVNIAAYVQFAASIPNFVLMESLNADEHVLRGIVDYPPTPVDGYFAVPDRPGIGLDIQEDVLADYPYVEKRITGWFQADGSVAH